MSKEDNIHQKERKKNKVKGHILCKNSTEKDISVMTTTPALCSCYMCGNPRKHFKEKTIQEISFEQTQSFD